ncbi:unnamed protein product, partial [marine sediment metagenome]
KFFIDKYSFDYALKKLNAFIIDYLHYIDETGRVEEINRDFNKLEQQFNNDTNYHSYVHIGKGNLNISQEIQFNKKYISYIYKAFDLSFLMSNYLQKSLNLTSREIIKNIQFVNYDGFFQNLSHYRDEMSNNLSNLKYENLYEHFKKILGYYYTYRYLIIKEYQNDISSLLKLIYQYIIDDKIIRNIIRIKENAELTPTFKQDIRKDFVVLRNAFNKIYYLCNYSLSMKNILPKNKSDILVDNTLI